MLVLSRKVGESIVIEDIIEITIVGVQGKYARVAINAPRLIKIHRKEIHEKICKDKEADYLAKIYENNRRNEESAKELGISMDTFLENDFDNLD